jgi:hypothetical protein
MKKITYCLLLVAFIAVLASCQKEVSNESGNPPGKDSTTTTTPGDSTTHKDSTTEVGTWKFVSLHTTYTQTTTYTQSGFSVKGVTSADFVTTNNSGTIKFDGSNMISTGISLSINTTANTDVYVNGVKGSSVPLPIDTSFAPQNDTSGYKKIGADSLYLQSGGFFGLGAGGLIPTNAVGCKLKFNGNTMTMTVIYDNSYTDNSQGFPAQVTSHAVLEATLQKQ